MAHIKLPPDLDKHKSKMENELLIKLGVKKEEFNWHPDIIGRKTDRPNSRIHIQYPVDVKLGRPKCNSTVQNRNPWSCSNQALRQMTMISRHGPRVLYFNKKQSITNAVNILKLEKSSV